MDNVLNADMFFDIVYDRNSKYYKFLNWNSLNLASNMYENVRRGYLELTILNNWNHVDTKDYLFDHWNCITNKDEHVYYFWLMYEATVRCGASSVRKYESSNQSKQGKTKLIKKLNYMLTDLSDLFNEINNEDSIAGMTILCMMASMFDENKD